MRKSLLCVLAVLLAGGLMAEEKKAAVPNVEYAVQLKPAAENKLKGTTAPYADVISIKDGKLSTQTATKHGFPAGECKVATVNGKTTITAEQKDETHGTNAFTLEVQGAAITGTMKWSKLGEDGKEKSASYTITGKQKG